MDPAAPTKVLLKRFRVPEHILHAKYAGSLPLRDVAVERCRALKHTRHVPYVRHVPLSDRAQNRQRSKAIFKDTFEFGSGTRREH